MKIQCTRSNLLNGLNIVSKAVPNKTTMSILECVLLEAGKDGLILVSNDMEMGIETRVEAEIITPGAICLEAGIFMDMIRKLPENDVFIETDETMKTTIRCEKAIFRLMGRSNEEFSYLPEIERFDSVVISQLTLKDIIRQTIFSISTNESNKVMTGELLEINGNQLRLVSLDGHRVSIRKVELKNSYPFAKAIVPGKVLSEISKILSDNEEKDVAIYITGKHIIFEFDETVVVSRLIDGEYFKIEQLLSTDYETRVKIRKRELMECLERATLLVREGDKKPVVMDIRDEQMMLRLNSTLGSMNDELEIAKQGKDLVIGFNPRFLNDVLRVIDEDEINVFLVNYKSPCFIKDAQESYIYLILPVNLPIES